MFTKLDPSFHAIGTDISDRMETDKIDFDNVRDDFFQRVRDMLQITVIGGNFWSKNHKKGQKIIYKCINTGKRSEKTGYVLYEREDYSSFQEFQDAAHIDEFNGERFPTRDDIIALEGLDLSDNKHGFLEGWNYIFDNGEKGVGIFTVTTQGRIQILDDISNITYAYIRTIVTTEGLKTRKNDKILEKS